MMSRTVRYFKLMYIVAGILMSNEDVCETVDHFHITPRVEVKEMLQPKKVSRSVEQVVTKKSCKKSWLKRLDVFGLGSLKSRLLLVLSAFNIWTIPNYLLEHSCKYLSKTLFIGSDCDMIYNR